MSVPEIGTVRTILSPLHPLLDAIVRDAWAEWLVNPNNAVFRYGRTRACIVYEHMVRLAEERFSGLPSVVPIPRHQSQGWLVAGQVHLRLKKGDISGRSCNYPTNLALALHDHEQDLPGIPLAMRVEVVYVLDALATQIDQVLVACRNGANVAWSYLVHGVSKQEGSAIIRLPTFQTPPTKPQLVRLRNSEQERDGDEQQSS